MKKIRKDDSQDQYISELIHELNQPITAIKAYLGGCELRIQKNKLSLEQILSVLQKINEQADFLKNKIDSLYEHISQEKLIEKSADVHSVITEIISLYSYEIKHHKISLILNFQRDFPNFHIDSFQIRHVLFRLLKQCIHTVEKNKLHRAKLEIQTYMDKSSMRITIKSNFLIKEEDFKNELTYCNTFLDQESGVLLAELCAHSICFQLTAFQQR
ncbi:MULTISPECIES: HAMP domain-containing histidine kinase [Legionella]|uniref:histidine kinase n=1 Tax=Legionella resiliens TaxID=2905958 RepID=A0ABS8X007_9GAMM|nr:MULTISPECIES: HAMP domain-containing histidine kinase [unclassified Legionella]MCE0722900.1 histidine kinase [Legionella sp. 9fVS26]MCE3532053.1 histidine kinase [Legionella sp. 8cVS16]QLZ68178.1 Adaptive-response sensory-kinase SasA [Legionella sp. PC1000]